ncbi:MAG: hydroxymethylbilane synthase [Pseudomonadota bacterium]|nr:hydroxymethylbilane synthase [Pseudomonadota bacterium]
MTMHAEIFETQPLVLASRASALAMAQAEIVRDGLAPVSAEILSLTTRGDRILDRPLAEAGGKGLFVKELERRLLDGECDAAVHSMKDMEIGFADGTEIVAVLPREDRRDALIGPYEGLDSLPQGAVIGTASVRRRALLNHHRPDLKIELLRGNINTRLAALADGRFDAIVLALAGLRRLSIDVPHVPLDLAMMPPAAAQGALAVQARSGAGERDRAVAAVCGGLSCRQTLTEVTAERALLGHLDGSCHTPIAASARLQQDGTLHLDGMILSTEGDRAHRAHLSGGAADAERIGHELGERLLADAGGRGFLA